MAFTPIFFLFCPLLIENGFVDLLAVNYFVDLLAVKFTANRSTKPTCSLQDMHDNW